MPEIDEDVRSIHSNMLAAPHEIIARGSTNNKNQSSASQLAYGVVKNEFKTTAMDMSDRNLKSMIDSPRSSNVGRYAHSPSYQSHDQISKRQAELEKFTKGVEPPFLRQFKERQPQVKKIDLANNPLNSGKQYGSMLG